MDGMHFDNDEKQNNWLGLGNDFVYELEDKKIKYFVKKMHSAKIETERKMRYELDHKILSMRTERLQ